jgi:hypothetical protein
MHRRRRSPRAVPAALAVAPLVLLLAAGCSRPATSPLERNTAAWETSAAGGLAPAELDGYNHGPRSAGSYADLGTGKTSRIQRSIRVRVTPAGGVPGPWETLVEFERDEVTGVEMRGGVAYRALRVEIEGDPTSVVVDLLRADRSGLYLWDGADGAKGTTLASSALPEIRGEEAFARALAGSGAAGSAAWTAAWTRIGTKVAAVDAELGRGAGRADLTRKPGGVLPDEIMLLAYPFRPGTQWEGRTDFNLYTVEGVELLETSAGNFHVGRLRLELPAFFGPNDRLTTWWGAPGEVARVFHAEGDATDEYGDVLGTVEYDETVSLLAYGPSADSIPGK